MGNRSDQIAAYLKLSVTIPAVLFIFPGTKLQAQNATARPNVVFVLGDDFSYGQLSYYGNPVLKTPNFDKLAVVPYTSCGQCASCQRGREYACQYNQTLGVQRDGAMQEYITVPWRKVLKAPSLNELELAMVEPLTVGFHAVSRGRVTDTDVVAVLGCGMIGAGAIIRAALRGATVIAVDIDDHKLEMAKQLGADFTINSSKSDLHNELSTLTRGRGPDVTIEAAGNPITYQAALNETSFTGRVVFIGYVKKDVELPTKLIVQKELDILGSRNASPQDFRAVISYLEKKNFPTDKLITRKVRPENAAEAVGSWAKEPGKVMKILLDLT